MHTLTRSNNQVDPHVAAAQAAALDLSSLGLKTLIMGKNNQNNGDSDSGKLRAYISKNLLHLLPGVGSDKETLFETVASMAGTMTDVLFGNVTILDAEKKVVVFSEDEEKRDKIKKYFSQMIYNQMKKKMRDADQKREVELLAQHHYYYNHHVQQQHQLRQQHQAQPQRQFQQQLELLWHQQNFTIRMHEQHSQFIRQQQQQQPDVNTAVSATMPTARLSLVDSTFREEIVVDSFFQEAFHDFHSVGSISECESLAVSMDWLGDVNTCSICFSEKSNNDFVQLLCGHAFCSGCIGKIGDQCALCRMDLFDVPFDEQSIDTDDEGELLQLILEIPIDVELPIDELILELPIDEVGIGELSHLSIGIEE